MSPIYFAITMSFSLNVSGNWKSNSLRSSGNFVWSSQLASINLFNDQDRKVGRNGGLTDRFIHSRGQWVNYVSPVAWLLAYTRSRTKRTPERIARYLFSSGWQVVATVARTDKGTRTHMHVRASSRDIGAPPNCLSGEVDAREREFYLRARDSCNTRGASAHVSVHASLIERENLERREEENAGKIAERWRTCGVRDEMAIRSRWLVRPASSLYIDRNALVARLALQN